MSIWQYHLRLQRGKHVPEQRAYRDCPALLSLGEDGRGERGERSVGGSGSNGESDKGGMGLGECAPLGLMDRQMRKEPWAGSALSTAGL